MCVSMCIHRIHTYLFTDTRTCVHAHTGSIRTEKVSKAKPGHCIIVERDHIRERDQESEALDTNPDCPWAPCCLHDESEFSAG